MSVQVYPLPRAPAYVQRPRIANFAPPSGTANYSPSLSVAKVIICANNLTPSYTAQTGGVLSQRRRPRMRVPDRDA